MNKQIEEMAKDMCEYYYEGTCYQDKKTCDLRCESMTDAQYLYAKGYRKQSEGEWIKDNTSKYEHRYNCSVCNYRFFGIPTNYCPNCGARMKGDQNAD